MNKTVLLGLGLMAISSSIEAEKIYGNPACCLMPAENMVGWWPGDGNANDILNLPMTKVRGF